MVNYDETGPSYTSAYGLVAAYHIKQVTRRDGTVVELDNQIRTHGSVDYMSILRRYSHGCHRLYNTNAVRLFSFVLLHRDYIRHGQTALSYRRNFEYKEKKHHLALDTRGYRYELTPPLPIEVTEGRIRGKRRTPYTEYMPKPGVIYDEEEEVLENEVPIEDMGLLRMESSARPLTMNLSAVKCAPQTPLIEGFSGPLLNNSAVPFGLASRSAPLSNGQGRSTTI